jgi:hypothetical protein
MRALFGRYPKQQVSHTVAIMNRTPFQPLQPFDRAAAQASLFGTLEWQDDAAPPAPFAEPIHGLQVREIDGCDVFHHFFGSARISH